MGGKSAPKADPFMGIAAMQQAQTGQAWLDFSKSAWADTQQRQIGIDELTKRVTEQQIAAQDDATKWAREDRDRYKSVFQPLQDQFIEKANNWDSADRQSQAAAEAKADVSNAFAQQEQARQRVQTSMGVNPASGRYDGSARAMDTAGALASAGAENNARAQLRAQAMALKGEAINMGNGLPSQASQALGLGVQSGSAAVGNTVSAQQPRFTGINQMGQGYQGAMQGWAGAGDTMYKMGQLDQNAYNMDQAGMSGLMSGLGGAIGLGYKMYTSDEDQKEGKKPVKGILDAMKDMRVESWRYKEDSDAHDGGEEHVGTYAQDFKKATGLGDGKSINVIDAIGVTMGAVKELAEKVDHLQPGRASAKRPKAKSIMRAAA